MGKPLSEKERQQRTDAMNRLQELQDDLSFAASKAKNPYIRTHYRQLAGYVLSRKLHHRNVLAKDEANKKEAPGEQL